MDIRFCDECDASVPGADLEGGAAARMDGRLVCARCLPRVRRARALRIALIPLSLLAAAAAGAVIAVLLLSPRLERAEDRSKALETTLLESDREYRGVAAEVRGLRQVSAEQMKAISDLRRAFDDSAVEIPDRIRQVSELAAGNVRQIRAIKELIARRIQAEAEAMGGTAPSPASLVEVWLGLLEHEDAGVRLSALVALEGEEDERVAVAILAALADEDPAIRAQAAAMAGVRGLTKGLPVLLLLLEDDSVHVRQAAAQAFSAISGKNFGFEATDPEEERSKALDAMRAWLLREE